MFCFLLPALPQNFAAEFGMKFYRYENLKLVLNLQLVEFQF
nr:hypothetical protein [uncultured Campylobacter sp.]